MPEDTSAAPPAQAPVPTQWPLPARYLAGIFLMVLGAVGVLLLLPLLQLLFLAFLIAFLMFLPARALTQRLHLPYRLAVLLMFLGLGLIFGCALVNIIPRLIESFDQLWQSAPLGKLLARKNSIARALSSRRSTRRGCGVFQPGVVREAV